MTNEGPAGEVSRQLMMDLTSKRSTGILRILHVEDNPLDSELMAGWLEEDGLKCEIVTVQSAAQFGTALDYGEVDVIISDCSVPAFDGLTALDMAHQRRPEVPFIIFSGTIGEELAIECLKQGATDYILKQRPQRLV